MAKRKVTVPIAVVLPMAAMAYRGAKQIMSQDWGGLSRDFTGYDVTSNQFTPMNLLPTYGPPIIGTAIHAFLGPRINRALASAGVPLLRI